MYFTSDLHLGHEKVADMRGFKSVEAHDETIANNWMEAVGKNDVVYILGDISCCSRRSEIAALDLIEALPGTKRLIAGNHDSVWAGNRHAWRNMRMFHEVFEGVAPFARLRWNREPVLLSHFPYDGDHTREDRHREFRLKDHGMPLLHGHTHSSHKFSKSRFGTLQIHVGVDAWDFTPVDLNKVFREGNLWAN